jgi:hypothetical protein
MLYRYIPEALPVQTRAATHMAATSSESSRSRAILAIGMLCVPLISFGFVLALYLFLTV